MAQCCLVTNGIKNVRESRQDHLHSNLLEFLSSAYAHGRRWNMEMQVCLAKRWCVMTWHVPWGLLKWAGCVSDAVFSFCIVVSQCHGRISSSTEKRRLIHFPYFLLYVEAADPGARTASSGGRGDNSRAVTQPCLRYSCGCPDLQQA